jgi:VWFA-related protein
MMLSYFLTVRDSKATRWLSQAVPYQPVSCRFLLLIVLCLGALTFDLQAQTQKPTPSPSPDDVIRINTELVQTDVMVFDKKGRFVDGLQREQFELNVDGKPQPISSFEQIRAGSLKDSARLTTNSTPVTPSSEKAPINESHGRTIVFFIDDLHLSLDSLGRTRKTLAQFIDHEMNDNDRVAIASTSGDIGFLQQFSENKSVLHAAADRLTHHPYKVRDITDVTTPMTEYMALTIERKDDPGVLEFYIDECLRAAYPLKYTRAGCDLQVKSRARLILLQAASVILNTYDSLESLMRSSAQLPGRKLVFMISDGFLLDTGPRNSDPRGKLSQITDAALRAGVVIYTIDARGLFSGQLDATNNVPFDKQNRLESASLREGPSAQDALNALAGDTGGRALRNTNYFDRWVNKILDETSQYYLLAWRPNREEGTSNNFKRIAVRVIDHPEYSVRLPRGFLKPNGSPAAPRTAEAQTPAQTHRDLQQALTALYPKAEIPISLSLVFLDTPGYGPVLTASVRVSNQTLSYEASEGKLVAAVDVVGVVLNDKGKPAGTFQTRLKISPTGSDSAEQNNSATIYNARVPLTPGLYQVRVASRDTKNGQVGSAQQWVQIPDLALHRLTMSSLLLGVQNVELKEAKSGAPATSQVQFSVDHRFVRNSRLNFMGFIYNAARGLDGKSPPNIWLQARLLRDGQIVKTTPMKSVPVASQDLVRIPFGGQIALDSIQSGPYILEIVVDDQIAKTTVSQRTKITVE